MIYPNLNKKKEDGSPADYRKDMSPIVANAFRQGYSTRTFMGYNMFPYRDDNVQRRIKQLKYYQKAHDVEFNIYFNINKIEFCSKLNEDLMATMKENNFAEAYTKVLEKDHQVHKR